MINEIQSKIKFQNIVQCPFNLRSVMMHVFYVLLYFDKELVAYNQEKEVQRIKSVQPNLCCDRVGSKYSILNGQLAYY